MIWVVAYTVATFVYNWCSGLPGLPARAQALAHALWCLLTVLTLAVARPGWRWPRRWREPFTWQALASGLGGVAAGTGSLLAVVHKDLLAAQILLRAGSLVLAGLLDPQPSVFRRWALVLPVVAVVVVGLTGRPEFAAEAVPALALYLGGYAVKYYVARRQRLPILAVPADDLFAHETLVSAVAFVAVAYLFGSPVSAADAARLHVDPTAPRLSLLALWSVALGGVGAQLAVVAWTRLLSAGRWQLGALVPVMRSAGLFAALAVTLGRGQTPASRDLAGFAVLVAVTYLGRPPADKEAHGPQRQD